MESARARGLSPGPWFSGRGRRSGAAGGPPLSRTVLPGWLSRPPRSLYKVSRFRRIATLSSWAPEKSRGLGVRRICEPSHLDMTGRGWKFHSDPGRHRSFTGESAVSGLSGRVCQLCPPTHLPFRPLSGRRPASASEKTRGGGGVSASGTDLPGIEPKAFQLLVQGKQIGAATLRSGWRIVPGPSCLSRELPCCDEFLAFLPLPS
jgi:hypothetical protein